MRVDVFLNVTGPNVAAICPKSFDWPAIPHVGDQVLVIADRRGGGQVCSAVETVAWFEDGPTIYLESIELQAADLELLKANAWGVGRIA